MKDYFKTNLTTKLFLLVCIALIGTSLMICGLFAVIMPKSYVEMQNEEFDQELNALISTFEDKSMKEVEKSLADFAENMEVYLELHDSYTGIIAFFGDENSTYITITEDMSNSESYDFDINDNVITTVTRNISQIKELIIDGESYVLISFGSATQAVNEVTLILKDTIPFIITIMVIISLCISLFLSRFITNPIKEIGKCAKEIADLSFDIRCDENRSDELGELAHNINELSFRLNNALSSLQNELIKEKALEESHRLFFSAASHELKTPLTVIKGNLEGMVYGYKEYENKDIYISKTLKTVAQMEHLIGEILNFSAIQGDKYVLTKEDVNIRHIIEEQLIHFAEIIELKHFLVVQNLSDVSIACDKKLFAKAIGNIISNALYYSPKKETITITLTDKELLIENTGVSISDLDMAKLFEPFYRVDKSRNRQTGGSGLGLHFVKTILNKHNFDFSITSEDNKVLFTVLFNKLNDTE